MQVSKKPAMKGQKQDEAGEAKLRRGFSEALLSSTADVLPCDSLPHQPLSIPVPSSVANIMSFVYLFTVYFPQHSKLCGGSSPLYS